MPQFGLGILKTIQVVSNDIVTLSLVEGFQEDNGIYPLELNTMPGWAGSSQYFNRYMDPQITRKCSLKKRLIIGKM